MRNILLEDLPATFDIYDDRSKSDNITLAKKDIVFLDQEVCLVRFQTDWANSNILICLKTREVLSKDFDAWYVEQGFTSKA